jgi:hypothetical protein
VIKSNVFEVYRQVEMLNYFSGKEIFTLISYDKGFSSDEDTIALFEMFFIIFNIRASIISASVS